MFKDYVIIDNVFNESQLDRLNSLSKKINYYSNESPADNGVKVVDGPYKPRGAWRGYRSDLLQEVDYNLWVDISGHLISSIFGIKSFSHSSKSFIHLLPGNIAHNDGFWHTDDYELFAGVVYLNQIPDPDSGTLLKLNGDIINIENKFNRLIFYKASILHMPAGWHGKNINEMRTTMNFFVGELEFLAPQKIQKDSKNNTWF